MSHQTRTVILAGVTAGAIGVVAGIIIGIVVYFFSASAFAEEAATVKADTVAVLSKA